MCASVSQCWSVGGASCHRCEQRCGRRSKTAERNNWQHLLVVMASLNDYQGFAHDHVNNAMLIVDPTRPRPLQHVTQGLWLPNASERITKHGDKKTVEAFQHNAIRILPVQVVLPPSGRELKIHSSKSCDEKSPARACSRPVMRRAAFAGERRR